MNRLFQLALLFFLCLSLGFTQSVNAQIPSNSLNLRSSFALKKAGSNLFYGNLGVRLGAFFNDNQNVGFDINWGDYSDGESFRSFTAIGPFYRYYSNKGLFGEVVYNYAFNESVFQNPDGGKLSLGGGFAVFINDFLMLDSRVFFEFPLHGDSGINKTTFGLEFALGFHFLELNTPISL